MYGLLLSAASLLSMVIGLVVMLVIGYSVSYLMMLAQAGPIHNPSLTPRNRKLSTFSNRLSRKTENSIILHLKITL